MKKYYCLLLLIIISLILGACNTNSSSMVEPVTTVPTQFESTTDLISTTETMISTELADTTSSLITIKPTKPENHTSQTSTSIQITPSTTTSKVNETTTKTDLIETTTQFIKPDIIIEETTTSVTKPTKKCDYEAHWSYILHSYDQDTDTMKRYCQLCDSTEYIPIQPISIQLKKGRLHIYGGYYARATCYITDEKGRREYELDGWPASLAEPDYSGYYFLLSMDKSNEGMIIEIYVSDRSGRNATATYKIVQTEDQNYTTVLI